MSLIFCKCGCEQELEEFDSRGRLRQYIHGHGRRGKTQIPWNMGIPCRKETKDKISKANKGKLIGRLNPNFGKYGSQNPNWKDGISNLNQLVRVTSNYKEWRLQVFRRDNFICQECGIKNKYIEPHHIKGIASILRKNNITTISEALQCNELWDIDNGTTLCKTCHEKTNNYQNKKGELICNSL